MLPMFKHRYRMAIWLAMMAFVASAGDVSYSADFRVTTEIYENASPKPAAKHLILFAGNLTYDLAEIQNRDVTVYDPDRKRVILLDRVAKTRTTINTEDLVRITAQARAAAETSEQQQRLGIAASPENQGPKYSISYGDARYETTTETPSEAEMAVRYGQFVDLASRLNLVHRRGLPPFARMSLSQRIASDGKIPTETTLTIRRGVQVDRFRSSHTFISTLSQQDRQQIDEIGGMLALYKEVPL
ncbi:putative secreted protein [Rhodopirellula maiorica SM1]|uniref:Putative secreted protein n=1 Tax=Rhodopirellula maiorica SM1 TaxID=1265738 RepID=M5RSJ6_9BACT|nr:hypothetical protein [Rhodopirellula maiorica]EMI22191.1 putative secreted protein [Rhodopirellula maiorica SM1]